MDALTGVPNRRAFDERLEREIERARRDNRSIALMMIDVDYFKNFNDAYGHQQGDDTLVRAAADDGLEFGDLSRLSIFNKILQKDSIISLHH